MVVFWGTQSGTAKTLAKSLAREALARYNIKSMTADLDDYDHSHLEQFPKSKIAIFIVSTYGEGDPPDNALDFFSVVDQFRCSEQGEKILKNLRFAAFGLGNRNYAHYNKMVDLLDDSFRLLGAERLIDIGKGDESTASTQRDFTEWTKQLFEFLAGDLDLRENQTLRYIPTIEVKENPQARPTLVYRGEPNKDHLTGHFHKLVNQNNPHKAPVTDSRQLFTSSTRHCLHLEFDITGFPSQQMSYETGDHLAVWPTNPSTEVDRMLSVLGLESKDNVIDVISLDGDAVPIPTPTTTHTALRFYLEICGAPTRDTLSLLPQFAPSQKAAQALVDLGESHETFKSQVTDCCVTLAQVRFSLHPLMIRFYRKLILPPALGHKFPFLSSLKISLVFDRDITVSPPLPL